jgi:hypothetical protein
MSSFSVDMQGMKETQRALDELERALHRPSAGELRATADGLRGELVGALVAAAGSSGVPVASRVAQTIRPSAEGSWPAVSIGGSTPVGRYGAIAAKLLWGSEHGAQSDPNRFAAGPSAGYWIAPTVKRFKDGPAMRAFTKAVDGVAAKAGFK